MTREDLDKMLDAIQGTSSDIAKNEMNIIRLENEIKRSTGILSNQGFLAKAPAAKVENEKKKLEDYKKQYDVVIARLQALNA